jgi:hypothetical protein
VNFGDIISLDVGVIYNGFIGDNARTVAVGGCSVEAQRLMDVPQQVEQPGSRHRSFRLIPTIDSFLLLSLDPVHGVFLLQGRWSHRAARGNEGEVDEMPIRHTELLLMVVPDPVRPGGRPQEDPFIFRKVIGPVGPQKFIEVRVRLEDGEDPELVVPEVIAAAEAPEEIELAEALWDESDDDDEDAAD